MMVAISFLDKILCTNGTYHHDWIVTGYFDDTCKRCKNVKDIRDGKIYQWSDD